jgi:hypothetical protein
MPKAARSKLMVLAFFLNGSGTKFLIYITRIATADFNLPNSGT